MDGGAIIFPILLLVGIATGLLFGAIILRLACSACSVDDPTLPKAVGIVFLTSLATAAVSIVPLQLASAGTSDQSPLLPFPVMVCLILLPMDMVTSTGIYRCLLHTSFKRSLRIWLTRFALSLCLAIVVALLVVLVLIFIEAGAPEQPAASPTPVTGFSPG